ncbi:galanin receptor type 1-like [Dendronephthya gigantea]|uniref:galanin receptor type 1-like n=1 Tax=Dendronephthya gigantea TaxID=151771 RepID=UPI00106BA3A4|nr:galanin receptor type 1-like [Dendronephthya gigantea]
MNSSNNSTTSEDWMSKELVIANIVFDVIILAVSVLGNFLVIFTIIHEKKLQTTCNFLLLHLAVSDISLVVVNIPFDIHTLVNGSQWLFGNFMCRLLYPISTVFYISGALILTVISLDRYRVFVQTFKAKLRRSQAKKLIAFVYVFSIASVVPYSLNLKLEGDECFESWSKFRYRQLYTVFLFLIQYTVPLVIMTVVYTSIARHLTRKTQRVNLSRNGPRRRISLYSGGRTKTRCEVERDQRNRKALKTIITVVIVFSVFMLPYQLLWIIADFQGMDEEKLSKLSKLFVVFSYIGSCTVNPFIYGVGDKQFRKGYRSFLNHLVSRVTGRKLSRKLISDGGSSDYWKGNRAREEESYVCIVSIVSRVVECSLSIMILLSILLFPKLINNENNLLYPFINTRLNIYKQN